MYTLALPCPTLIGRTDDLATLHLLVDRAGKGQGGVALVCGEAGIGKSRLVAEVKTEALAHDFWLLQGGCFPTDQAIPYAPLLDLLRSFLTSRALALPATEIEPMVQAFLPLLPDLGHLFAGEPPPPAKPSLDPEQEKRRRFEVLAHFLTAQAGKHPLLLVVEDLHWSDDISLEFLHYLARRCATHPLLLLLTYRSDEVRSSLRHFLAQLDREHLAQEISLAGLMREEVEAMLRTIFALPRSLRLELPDPLYGLTEGNPFFIEEVLKSLITAGEIFYANGRWERKELRELHIPRSVQDAVQQSLGQALSQAQAIGSWNWMRTVSAFLSQALLLQQDRAQADSILTAALEEDAAMQTIGQRLIWAARADLALARGDPVRALDITDRLIASATNLSDEHVIPRLWKLRGEALAALGQTEEAEAVTLMAQGKSNREIAESLVVAKITVETHVNNILHKLGFTSRSQIVLWAIERGLTKH